MFRNTTIPYAYVCMCLFYNKQDGCHLQYLVTLLFFMSDSESILKVCNFIIFSGESSLKYKPNVLKLLGRLTVGQPKEPVPWNCYGRILVVDTDSNSATENQGIFNDIISVFFH